MLSPLLPLGLAYSARYCNRSPPLHHRDHWHRTCASVAEIKPEAAGRLGRQGPSRPGASTQRQGRRRSGDGGSGFEASGCQELEERKAGSDGRSLLPERAMHSNAGVLGGPNIFFHSQISILPLNSSSSSVFNCRNGVGVLLSHVLSHQQQASEGISPSWGRQSSTLRLWAPTERTGQNGLPGSWVRSLVNYLAVETMNMTRALKLQCTTLFSYLQGIGQKPFCLRY